MSSLVLVFLYFIVSPLYGANKYGYYNGIVPSTASNSTSEIYHAPTKEAWKNGTIKCTKSECIVTCDKQNACFKLFVHAEASDSLHLTCSNVYSCEYITIVSAAKVINNIECTARGSCQYAVIDMQTDSTSLNMKCGDESIQHSYESPCYFAQVYAGDASSLQLDCTSASSCTKSYIYCPKNGGPCAINCAADQGPLSGSCFDMEIHTLSQYVDTLDIQCKSNTSCSGTSIICIEALPPHSVDYLYHNYGYGTEYLPYSMLRYQDPVGWGCATSGCCPFSSPHQQFATVTCDDDKEHCDIYCNDINGCVDYVIDGSMVRSLSVKCEAEDWEFRGCHRTHIKCPVGEGTTCNVECTTNKDSTRTYPFGGCEQATIVATDTERLNLRCAGNKGCAGVDIYGPSGECDIDCNAGRKEYEYNNRTCSNMNIYIAQVDNKTMHLDCGTNQGEDQCSNAWIHCDDKGEQNSVGFVYDVFDMKWKCTSDTSPCCPWSNYAEDDDDVTYSKTTDMIHGSDDPHHSKTSKEHRTHTILILLPIIFIVVVAVLLVAFYLKVKKKHLIQEDQAQSFVELDDGL